VLKALVFDVDGTLADTEETHRAAYNAAFAAHGHDWYWDHAQYARLLAISGGQARLRAFIAGRARTSGERRRWLGSVAALHATKTRFYADFVAAGRVTFKPGIARVIAEARAAQVGLALVSSTTPSNVDALLTANLGSGARGWFQVRASARDGQERKPAPDVFRSALARLGLPASACVAFEDTATGVAAARAAGLFTIALPTAWSAGQALSGAGLVLDHLGDPTTPLSLSAATRVGAGYIGILTLARLKRAWEFR